MRFVLVSTHTDQTTGYSKVAQNLLRQLATLSPKVKLFHFGFQRHPGHANIRKPIEGVNQYDAAANEDPKEEGFGINKINEYLDMVNPDVVLIYNDPLIIHQFVTAMKHERASATYRLWVYVDQVYEGIAQPLMDTIRNHADRVYCFTDTWRQRFLQYGEHNDVRVLGHAVDPTIFTRMTPTERITVRKSMGIPSDAVVFFNANRNSERKRIDLGLMGFVRLLQRYPDRPYYFVIATNVNPQAGAYYDVPRIFQRELKEAGLPESYFQRLLLIDTAPPNVLTDDVINQLYNATDIGVNTSDGEGFGLCQLEHLYTGAPQIVTDVGSYRSFLTPDVATFIPKEFDIYNAGGMPLGGWRIMVHPDKVADAMESASDRLGPMHEAALGYAFPSWAAVCDEFLEDVLSA